MKDSTSPGEYLQNVDAPLLEVEHANLRRASDNSAYRSVCPACPEGILMVGRDQDTFQLLEYDRCIVCGQLIKYLDIDDMRAREGY